MSNALRAGVWGIAKTLSRELAPQGILVNVIAPGRIDTERIAELDQANAQKSGKSIEDVRKASVASIPLGRLGRPEELANLVVFLASQAASYITGRPSPLMVRPAMRCRRFHRGCCRLLCRRGRQRAHRSAVPAPWR